MRRVTLSALAALCLAAPFAAAQPDYIDAAALHQADLAKFWQLQLPLAPGQQIVDAYLVDDQLYFGADDGYVYAVHAYSGTIRWLQRFTTGGYRLWRPVHAADRTVIVTPPNITQFDRQYGTPIKRVELRFPAGAPPASNGAGLFVGGLDRRMYAFRVTTRYPYEVWKAGTDSQIISRPVMRGEYLYYISDRGTLYACQAADKTFYWMNRSIGPVTADLVLDENGIYVASRDRSLYLVDPDLGGTRWRVRLSSALHEAPGVTPETAYQFSERDGLVAIDVKSLSNEDRIRWRFERGRRLLSAGEQFVYVATRDQHIAALQRDTGEVAHLIPATGFVHAIPSLGQGAATVLFLASRDGRVFCARQRGVPVVGADEVRAALGEKRGPDETATDTDAVTVQSDDEDYLETRQSGAIIGGKSKVTREFGRGSSAP